jgi:uncharacterized protein (TIGR00251 family)
MPNAAVSDCENGVLITVVVKPNSQDRRFVAEVGEEFITLNLQSPARDGKANTELLKKLAKTMSVSTGDLTIVSGHRSRDKTVMARGLDARRVRNMLQAAIKA